MSFRHAAALVLMGWYLMVPPGSCKPEWVSESKPVPCAAPLSDWIVTLSFSSADKCDAERNAGIRYGSQALANANSSADKPSIDSTRKLYWRALTERCIWTDDPRLKGN
ncbi:MAG: hypothetical protein JO121_31390 [Deltaproteobacteria bacterium]|jgi:hypothetical protein|nr:hypothetical protein [Deltaproteobacteria bacterium]